MQRPPMAVCFLLPELALLPAPALGVPGAGLPPLTRGPWEVLGTFSQLTPAWHLAASDALLQPPSLGAGLRLPRNVFARLAECRQTPGPDSGIEALGSGPEVWCLRIPTLAAR